MIRQRFSGCSLVVGDGINSAVILLNPTSCNFGFRHFQFSPFYNTTNKSRERSEAE
jgi:hypothetical protein